MKLLDVFRKGSLRSKTVSDCRTGIGEDNFAGLP